LGRSREIRTERDRTRRRPRLSGRREDLARHPRRSPGRGRAAETLVLRELGSRYRDDPESPGGRASNGGRILVVDDESALRLVCRVNLDSVGFDVLEAGDGETALSLARTEAPDLILLDVMLPGLDGWEVAEKLAELPETREIPIVFVTARSEVPDELRGHAAGGVGYIAKPFDPAALSQTVSTVLERVRRGERDDVRREWERSLPRD
jgi:CheY-like chemotaxis protein